jgi:AraC-like DNA-binding protein
MISWDLRGCEPHFGESLPHPNIHLVFGEGAATIHGVQTNKFERLLEGRAQVFGVKFRPGGFRPFFMSPISKLTDRSIPAAEVFGEEIEELGTLALSLSNEEEKIEAANAFFRRRLPKTNETIELADRLVERILNEPEIGTVDDLVERTGIGKRSLQRIFNEYVGVSPKWVIRRYRLHELIEKLNSGDKLNWAHLALELGYFDQAHLINDFKVFIGWSPSRYQRMVSTIK